MTSDDELIERLRRTLRAEAAALRPNPQEYPMSEPSGGRVLPFRARWALDVVAVAAAAAAAVSLALLLPGGSRKAGVITPAGSHASTTLGTAVPPTTSGVNVAVPPVTTTVPPQPTTTYVVTPPPSSVPSSFEPRSITFVSSYQGWVLGTDQCTSSVCLSMVETLDAGHMWHVANGPIAAVSPGDTLSVRFADPYDGWVRLTNPQAVTELWSTHDGGTTWRLIPAGTYGGGQITDLEASGGYAYMTAIAPGSAALNLYRTPAGADDWKPASSSLGVGAGPVPSTQLVLQRQSGWILQNDRTVVGGAQLSGGNWQPWRSAPCLKANGVGALAASDPAHLVAICTEGTWGPSGQAGAAPNSQWLFTSSDGGASFQATRALPGVYQATGAITSSGPGAVVAGALQAQTSGTGALIATFDDGLTWTPVSTSYSGVQQWADVGFTNANQGVAIADMSSGSILLMTRDGGHTWVPIDFRGQNP